MLQPGPQGRGGGDSARRSGPKDGIRKPATHRVAGWRPDEERKGEQSLKWHFLLLSAAYHFVQHFGRIRSLSLADLGCQASDQVPQLRFGHPNIKADIEMGLQLRIYPVHAGQGGNSRDFPTLKIKVVTAKDIAEQMAF